MDILDEIRGLRVDLAQFRSSSCHLLLMMNFDYLLAFRHKKGEYIEIFVLAYFVLVFVLGGEFIF